MATYDSAALLSLIRQLTTAPTATALGWTDADLLALVNHEQSKMLPAILEEREEYFVTYADTAIVAGTVSYRIDTRAIGSKLREVSHVDSDGQIHNLVEIQIEDLASRDSVETGEPREFYLRGADIVLFPIPAASSGSLRQHYLRRPNRIVATTAGMAITTVNSGTGVLSGTKPSTILTTTPCDIIRGTPHFDSLGDSKSPSAVVASTSVTFAPHITGVAVGDYVCLAGETVVPQLPVEFHPVLAERAAALLSQSNGHLEIAQVLAGSATATERNAIGVLSPRVEGEVDVLGSHEFM